MPLRSTPRRSCCGPAYIRGRLGEPDAALELDARAVAMYADLPPCRDHVVALRRSGEAPSKVSAGSARPRSSRVRAVTEARRLRIPSVLKEALAEHAWRQSMAGDTSGARSTIKELTAIELDPPDPYCEIDVAVCVTDILLMTGAPADELVDVARPALTAADTWGLHQWEDAILRSNVAEALVAQGDPHRAWDLVAPYTEGDPVAGTLAAARATCRARAAPGPGRGGPATHHGRRGGAGAPGRSRLPSRVQRHGRHHRALERSAGRRPGPGAAGAGVRGGDGRARHARLAAHPRRASGRRPARPCPRPSSSATCTVD